MLVSNNPVVSRRSASRSGIRVRLHRRCRRTICRRTRRDAHNRCVHGLRLFLAARNLPSLRERVGAAQRDVVAVVRMQQLVPQHVGEQEDLARARR